MSTTDDGSSRGTLSHRVRATWTNLSGGRRVPHAEVHVTDETTGRTARFLVKFPREGDPVATPLSDRADRWAADGAVQAYLREATP